MLHFWKKAFIFTIFLKIKVHPSNGTNLDSHDNLYSFCDWALKHVFFFGIHGFGALVLQKSFTPPFSLEARYVLQMGQTWLLIIILFSFIIRHHKHLPFIGYTIFKLWFCKNRFLFDKFSLSQIYLWNKTPCILQSFPFIIGHHKHILVIWVHNIRALVLQEKLVSIIFLWIKVRPSNETNMDSCSNLLSFYYWAP